MYSGFLEYLKEDDLYEYNASSFDAETFIVSYHQEYRYQMVLKRHPSISRLKKDSFRDTIVENLISIDGEF